MWSLEEKKQGGKRLLSAKTSTLGDHVNPRQHQVKKDPTSKQKFGGGGIHEDPPIPCHWMVATGNPDL